MSIWDEETKRDERRPPPKDEPGAPSAAALAVARLSKAHDHVRAAAQRDATEIVARARRNIRHVVMEARRELLELSAQVQAANVELHDASLPDPSIIEADDVPFHGPVGGDTSPDPEPGLAYSVPSGEDEPASRIARPLPSPVSARVFVALFTLVGITVLVGTVWWLGRGQVVPQPSSAAAGGSPSPRVDALATDPSSSPAELPVAFAADPLAPPGPDVASTSVVTEPAAAPPRSIASTATALPSASAAERSVPAPAPALASAPPPALAVPATATAPAVSAGSAGAPPSGSSAQTAMPAPPPASAGRGAAAARIDIAAFGRQWIDAYHRQDRSAMEPVVAPSLVINDERRADQRFPFGLEVSRAFEDEQLQLSGDSAVFSALMTERASTGAFVSHVSQTWVRRLGEWQLQEARIASAGQAEGR